MSLALIWKLVQDAQGNSAESNPFEALERYHLADAKLSALIDLHGGAESEEEDAHLEVPLGYEKTGSAKRKRLKIGIAGRVSLEVLDGT